MSNSFSTVSREIVDSFVHDVLFIDERAYRKDESEENPAQDFNLASVSKSFAEKGKLCSFYAPSTKEDIEVCKSLILRIMSVPSPYQLLPKSYHGRSW